MIKRPKRCNQILAMQIGILLACSNFISCKVQKDVMSPTISKEEQLPENESQEYLKKLVNLSQDELKYWYHKDYETDTIPGISLDKLYESGMLNNTDEMIIVAVLDTKLDIEHKDLKTQIWKNIDEIASNGIDDDQNGYIDDINGWDFLSNSDGEYVKFQSQEYVRIVQKYKDAFEDQDSSSVQSDDLENFKLYKQAEKELQKTIIEYENILSYYTETLDKFNKADKNFKEILQADVYDIQDIDDILVQSKDSLVISEGEFLKYFISNDWNSNIFENGIELISGALNINLNLDYDYRSIIGDNYEDITDIYYGSNVVSGDVPFQHSTPVSGVIGANRSNGFGIKGFSDNIKIMPVTMVSWGDETDKDIAVAIRYAVDNGAKIINMSWGKKYSMNEEWIASAFNYAAEHDVLLVHGSGNDGSNNDTITVYPNDQMKGIAYDDNYIEVGASSYNVDSTLITSFSNYGSENVDVFAPGIKIYTTDVNQKYISTRGTSLAAPLVSGLAALLRLHFPKLTAAEIKGIIMESGTKFDIPVQIRNNEGSIEKVSFQTLSKSGKIINAYNAFLLAKDVSNKIR